MTAFETPGPLALDLRVAAGEIELEAAETATTEVELEPLRDDDESRGMVERARIELRPRGEGHELLVDVTEQRTYGIRLGRRPAVRLRVRCPQGAEATVRTRSADVTAHGRFGPARVHTVSGEVAWESVDGDASFESTSGDLRVDGVTGGLTLKTVSGDAVAGTVGGRLAAEAVSGDLLVEAAEGPVWTKSVSGDQQLTVAAGEVALESVSGDLVARVRRGSRVFVDASALSGDVSSELDLSGEAADGEGPLVEIRARSVSGDVRIARA